MSKPSVDRKKLVIEANAEIELAGVTNPKAYKLSGPGMNPDTLRPSKLPTSFAIRPGAPAQIVRSRGVETRTKEGAWSNTDLIYRDHTTGKSIAMLTKLEEETSQRAKLSDAIKKPKVVTGASGLLPLLEANLDWSGTYYAHHGPIKPEYELLEAFTLYDVEVYVQQAINVRVGLMFRNGYRVTGDNANKVAYINRRLNQFAYMMKKSWANTMREILVCLSSCSNCFLLKLRQDDASGGVANDKNKNRTPIAAYVMIPPQSLFPWVEKGKITKWRRFYNWSIKPWEDYAVEDIIHLTWNRKPGHIFGTPRIQAVRDDIFAIRRFEENIELLFINFLFPLFHVKVGTKDAPASYLPGSISELDHTRRIIETMPKEGVFVSDERVEIKVVGASGQSLDPMPMLNHWKKRIFTGLGVSAVDMGEGGEAPAGIADTISQTLKDSIKYDLDTFSDQISMEILRDLFEEANFTLSVQESLVDVKLEFQEIDMDNKIKEEAHATNLYNSNGTTHDEFREALKRNPLSDEEQGQTHHAREVVGLAKAQGDIAIKVAKAAPKPTVGTTGRKPGGKKGKSGRKASVTKTAAPASRTTLNVTAPTNQHGTKLSPKSKTTIKSAQVESGLYLRLQDALEAASLSEDLGRWNVVSERIVERYFDTKIQTDGSSYTKHHRMQIDQLKEQVGQTLDLDTLFGLVSSLASQPVTLDPIAHGASHESVTPPKSLGRESCPEDSVGSGDCKSEFPSAE